VTGIEGEVPSKAGLELIVDLMPNAKQNYRR